MNKVIAVDFDGTICRAAWPEIGHANGGLIEWLKDCRRNGDKLILFTCREGKLLQAAVEWCKERGLEFDAVNDNLPELVARYGDNPRKISAERNVYAGGGGAEHAERGNQRREQHGLAGSGEKAGSLCADAA